MPEAMSQEREAPHTQNASDVIALLGGNTHVGLTEGEAAQRLAKYGSNALPTPTTRPAWLRFIAHFRDTQVYLLLIAAAVSFLVWILENGEQWPLEAIAILAIVLLNTIFGYMQEEKADAALAALRSMTPEQARVLRDGEEHRILARWLVPGDLLLIHEGDHIAADARLIEATGFHTQEAALTGESLPVMKTTAPLPASTAPSDRHNMVYSGTIAVSGHARAVVTATGTNSEFGRIAALLNETSERETPLQKELDHLGRRLGAAVVLIAAVVVGTMLILQGVHDGTLIVRALLFGVALAVAATPEGLAAVVTVVLALGVQRMARRGAIIRHLKAVETLGEATVIACDKTGTMTMNEMTVRQVVVASGSANTVTADDADRKISWTTPEGSNLPQPMEREVRAVLRTAALCNNASVRMTDGVWQSEGDPTESALQIAAVRTGEYPPGLSRTCPRFGEIPFSSERKRMSTLHHCSGDMINEIGASAMLLTKGAADVLLNLCVYEIVQGHKQWMSPERKQSWLRSQETMASQAMRTIGVAMRPLGNYDVKAGDTLEQLESELVFLGLVGMMDPPRPEARTAVATARAAGVRTIMITGDHAATALAVAREVDIPAEDVATGEQLDAMSDEDLGYALGRISVFARVNPGHKLRIVQALQRHGEIVAMTGDGVNDAPALKAADIGVAMGMTGTDVAKEAADMVVTDDNFATIVAAIEEGRGIFDNIRKFLRYLLATNAGEILTLFLGVAFTVRGTTHTGELVLPLLAVQILWINLVTDGAPALALGLEPPDEDVMNRPPFSAKARMIDSALFSDIGIVAVIMTIGTLAIFFTAGQDIEFRRTMAFTTLILFQLFNTLEARSSTKSAWHGIFRNVWLWTVLVGTLALQVIVLDLPWIAHAFGVVPLTLSQWLECALVASSVIWGLEVIKFARRQYLARRKEAYAA